MYVTNNAHQGPSTLNAVGTVLLASATREGAIRLTRLGVVLPASLFLSSQSHCFQPAQVLSASSVSATATHTAPVLCAGVTTASRLPSVFPRGGSPQHRQSGPSEVPPWSCHSCWVCVSAATGPSGRNPSQAPPRPSGRGSHCARPRCSQSSLCFFMLPTPT